MKITATIPRHQWRAELEDVPDFPRDALEAAARLCFEQVVRYEHP